MEVIEVVLLVLVYTVLTLTLFLEVVSYKKNIEPAETIAFTASLLLLVIALTVSYFSSLLEPKDEINVFVLLAMVLVSLTTPLNIIRERRHNLPSYTPRVLFIFSGLLGILVIAANFLGFLETIQYIVAAFLGISVVASMIFIQVTKPLVQFAKREKQQQFIALAFLVLIPLALFADFTQFQPSAIKTGFTVPILFLLLGASKLWDDIQRLSLFNVKQTVTEQDLDNYSLTKREKEVALLLLEGLSYKQIADKLFISLPTVKTHATNIYRKGKVSNRLELISLFRK